MIDDTDVLFETAARAVNRRRTSQWLLTAFTILAVVNALALIGLVAIGHDQQVSKKHARTREAHIDGRLDDIYRGLNTTSAQLGKLVTPPPSPIVLIVPTTTTTIRPASTAPRPSQPSSTTTTATSAPKPSSTTTTTTAPPPPSSTPSPPTTCVGAVVAQVCR